mmetsp:Transcript_27915/g.58959  ORF Transcript_27915/g.58959 Transcript_27915/m.58959 type:complete len:105 (+) Transcript_27915:882-1196(+)
MIRPPLVRPHPTFNDDGTYCTSVEFSFLFVTAAMESSVQCECIDSFAKGSDELDLDESDEPITDRDRKDLNPGDDDDVDEDSAELEVEPAIPPALLAKIDTGGL